MPTLFEQMKRYVGFSGADEEALRALHPVLSPHFEEVVGVFYERILTDPGARAVLVAGESQVGRLRLTLAAWLDRLVSGPWDEGFFEQRCRIGRAHVRIAMPQHYMFGAMNVIRQELARLVDETFADDAARRRGASGAVAKMLDLELAIMLHTYREDLLAQQARTERLATFGQLVGSIGHELRNPLAVIETSLFLLRGKGEGDEKIRKHLGRIGEQVGHANRIIADLLDLIRDRPLATEPVVPMRVFDSALASLTVPPDVRVSVDGLDGLDGTCTVAGDAAQLRQVFVNLLQNALQAVGGSGRIRVAGRRVDDRVEMSIEDSGPGIDPSIRRRLFEPLITTKEGGIGLGLALVRRIVERHGGTIDECGDSVLGGARFVMRLPCITAVGEGA